MFVATGFKPPTQGTCQPQKDLFPNETPKQTAQTLRDAAPLRTICAASGQVKLRDSSKALRVAALGFFAGKENGRCGGSGH